MGVSNGTTCPDRAISGARLPRHPSGGGLCNSHRAERQHGCSRSAGLWNAYPLAMRPRGGSGFPRNAQAKTGTVEWLRLIPALEVCSLEASLPFYEDAGFAVAYSRPEEAFVMLVCDGAALMLEEIGGPGRRLGGSLLERPLGRGINLQVQVTDVGGLHDRMAEGGWSVSRSWKGDGTAWTTARLAATSSWLSTRTDTYCGSLKTSARGTVSLALELTLLDLALSSNATRWTQVAAYLCRGSRVKCGLLLAGFVGGEWLRVVGWWVSCARAPRLISVLDRGAVGDMMVMGCCSRWGKRCGRSVFLGRPASAVGSSMSGAGRDGSVFGRAFARSELIMRAGVLPLRARGVCGSCAAVVCVRGRDRRGCRRVARRPGRSSRGPGCPGAWRFGLLRRLPSAVRAVLGVRGAQDFAAGRTGGR